MSSASRKWLVVNSDRFLTDICPVVLKELGLQEDSEDESPQGNPDFYLAVRRGNYKIVYNESIYREYLHTSRTYSTIQWLPVVEELRNIGIIINPRLRPLRRQIQGIPQRHNTFPIMAIRASADYLITEYPVWQRRADIISQYGPTVITPNRFIQIANV